MKKVLTLSLIMLLTLTLCGCALVEKDIQVDMATVVISIGDIAYTKANVINVADSIAYEFYSYYGNYYGEVTAKMFYDTAVEELRREALEEYMIQLLGIDQLTEKEQLELDEQIADDKQQELDLIKLYYFSGSELEGEEMDAAVYDLYTALGYTDEAVAKASTRTYLKNKLNAMITDPVTVSEEEARVNFDELVASAQADYASNLSSFGLSFNAGSQIYYIPAGYRYIKNLLVPFTEQDKAVISDLQTQISQKETLIQSFENSIAEYDVFEDSEMDEDIISTLDALHVDLAGAQAERDALNDALSYAQESAYAAIADTITAIREKIADGDDFNTLMAEFGKDSNTVNNTTGYAICNDFTGKNSVMVEMAMALTAPGDITQADIRISDGIQILAYTDDMQEGAIDFYTVKDLDDVTQLTQKKSEAYTAQLETWSQEHIVKVDTRPLKD